MRFMNLKSLSGLATNDFDKIKFLKISFVLGDIGFIEKCWKRVHLLIRK